MAFKTLQSDIDLCFASLAAEPAAVVQLLDTQLPGEGSDLDLALKTGIQNLETYRDHIKGWHVGTEVKDKLTSEPRSNTDSDILKLLRKSTRSKTQLKILLRRVIDEEQRRYEIGSTGSDEPEEVEVRVEPRAVPSPAPAARPRLAKPSPIVSNSLLKPAAAPVRQALKWATAAASPLAAPLSLAPAHNGSALAMHAPPALQPVVAAAVVATAVPGASIIPEVSVAVPIPPPQATPRVAQPILPYVAPVQIPPYNPLVLSPPERSLCEDRDVAHLPPGIQSLLSSVVHARANPEAAYTWMLVPYRLSELPAELAYGYIPKTDLMAYQYKWNDARGALTSARLHQYATAPAALEELVALFYGYYYAVTPLERHVAQACLVQGNWVLNNNKTWFQRIGQAQAVPGGEVGNYRMFDVASWSVVERHHFRVEYELNKA